ncbi:MAG: hypothetical protein M1828_003150 [Chrysothrix sp. TS-e1954]|nr:MAG: hypothetical protein M1828_003150 [Chrysothrix sp. TS-e1954]
MASALLPFMDINLHASDSHYAFLSPSNPNAPTLVVDRPSGDLRLVDGKISGAKRISSIGGILGIIKLRLDKYIIVITKSQPVGKIKGSTIYKVISTELLPLRERPLHDSDEDAYLALTRYTLKSGPMYYCYGMDLTNSFQRQAKSDPSQPMWQRADDRFFWNKFISTDLMDFRAGATPASGFRLATGPQTGADPYILPVISGMFGSHRTSVKGNPLTFMLMTRRSRHRTGTRYFSRGIDEEGHASNFNETEQVVVLNDNDSQSSTFANGSLGGSGGRDVQILAYVQTRGSVPVFWAEINKLKYTPDLQIRGVDSAVKAAKLHFDEQIRIYGDNYLVNLVNQKGRERGVKDAYEQLVRRLQSRDSGVAAADSKSPESVHVIESAAVKQEFDRLHYVYFDFHNETKGFRWHRTQLLLDELHEPLMKQQYFHGVYNVNDRSGRVEIRSMQKSVVRTNCMDCLDRTNVVQSMLGRFAINRMLSDMQILRRGEKAQEDTTFEDLFRNVWADNADIVSKSYSGSGALKTDFTRTGTRTKAGAMQDARNSIQRYIKNNFTDGPRQDAFDLFSGAFLPSSSGTGDVFVDHRPLLVQAMPYVFLASLFFISIATATTRLPDRAVWPLRLTVLLFFGLAVYSANFMISHGTLYVNWPKLNTPPFAVEGYQEALKKASKDPIVGSMVTSDRRSSEYKMGYMEEGKKRIE